MAKFTSENYCTIAGQFKGAQIRFHMDIQSYGVVLEGLAKDPKTQRTPIIRIFGKTVDELKDKILADYPAATFSTVNPGEVIDPLKKDFHAQMKAEAEAREKLEQERLDREAVISQHHEIAKTLSDEEKAIQLNFSIQELMNHQDSPYREWFKDGRQAFWSWADNSWQNRETLIRYLQARNIIIPTLAELIDAFSFLLTNGHFHMQASYKRSEVQKKNSVRPVSADDAQKSDEVRAFELAEAKQKLSAKFGVPFSVSVENLIACGYDEKRAKKIFAKLQEQYAPAAKKIGAMSGEDLKRELSAMRTGARGGALSRKATLSGY